MKRLIARIKEDQKKKEEKREKQFALLMKLYALPKRKLREMAKDAVFHAEKENQELFSLSRKLFSIGMWAYWLTMGVFLILVIYFPEFLKHNLEVLPKSEVVVFVFVLSWAAAGSVLITNLVWWWASNLNPRNAILDPLAIPREKKRTAIAGIIGIVVSLGALLYLVGFVNALSVFISHVIFPKVSSLVNMIIANIVSWVFSGVIGNFFYDMLKRAVMKEKKEVKHNGK